MPTLLVVTPLEQQSRRFQACYALAVEYKNTSEGLISKSVEGGSEQKPDAAEVLAHAYGSHLKFRAE